MKSPPRMEHQTWFLTGGNSLSSRGHAPISNPVKNRDCRHAILAYHIQSSCDFIEDRRLLIKTPPAEEWRDRGLIAGPMPSVSISGRAIQLSDDFSEQNRHPEFDVTGRANRNDGGDETAFFK